MEKEDASNAHLEREDSTGPTSLDKFVVQYCMHV